MGAKKKTQKKAAGKRTTTPAPSRTTKLSPPT